MSDEYEIGDAVQLKSGGPAMTVNDVCMLTGDYHCVWFNGCIKQQSTFDGSILKTWEPPEDDNDDGYHDDDGLGR